MVMGAEGRQSGSPKQREGSSARAESGDHPRGDIQVGFKGRELEEKGRSRSEELTSTRASILLSLAVGPTPGVPDGLQKQRTLDEGARLMASCRFLALGTTGQEGGNSHKGCVCV